MVRQERSEHGSVKMAILLIAGWSLLTSRGPRIVRGVDPDREVQESQASAFGRGTRAGSASSGTANEGLTRLESKAHRGEIAAMVLLILHQLDGGHDSWYFDRYWPVIRQAARARIPLAKKFVSHMLRYHPWSRRVRVTGTDGNRGGRAHAAVEVDWFLESDVRTVGRAGSRTG